MTTCIETEIYHKKTNTVYSGYDAKQIHNLDAKTLYELNIRRGDLVEFSEVQITVETEMVPEYRFGHSGQKVERVITRSRKVLNSEMLKLWKSSTKGWYWK